MDCASSHYFFHTSNGPFVENNLESRWACLRDFLIRCAVFPFALLAKGWKTLLKGAGLVLAALLLVVTLGSSSLIRGFFVKRSSSLACELADWVLFPFALLSCLGRLVLGLLVHPTIYFNRPAS